MRKIIVRFPARVDRLTGRRSSSARRIAGQVQAEGDEAPANAPSTDHF